VYVNDYIAIDIRKGSRQIMGMCHGMVFSLLLKVKFLKKEAGTFQQPDSFLS
jgi:hypothetical protein